MLVVALVAFAGTATYVGYAAVRAAQPVALPGPAGPYPVGRTITEWTDDARADPLAPLPPTPRRLSTWLWYPATPGPHPGSAPYAPGAWAGLHLGGLLSWSETGFDQVHVAAAADVPVAGGRFPVVVLEPGLGFAAPQYTTIAENLAANGYLVVGVTPTYSANLTVLDGAPVAATEAGNPPAFATADLHSGAAQAAGDRLVAVWADDARFAAAHIATEPTFAGHVDPAGTVYIGHSFGGAAALQACHDDSRCRGAADLDGTQYGTVVHSGLDKPLMIIGSENSCTTGFCPPAADQADRDAALSLLRASRGPAWCFRISGAEHFNFSDYGAFFLAEPADSLIALGSIDGRTALVITNAYLRAFVGRAAHAEQDPLLAGTSPYPEVQVHRTAR
ncbi:alpha/beta hydrolase [Amycolatopsis sp. NPDC004378]